MHWYTKDGKPCHTQPDGKDTTLRHARKQDLVPSVTEITNVMDKPGLNRYLINQTLEAAYNSWDALVDRQGLLDIDYLTWCKEIRQKASEHSEQAKLAGIAIHDALDKAFRGKEVPDEHLSTVDSVSAALYGVYGDMQEAKPEVTFATDLYGGTVDLVAPGVIVDYKRKADGWDLKKDGTPKKMWYVESHAAQLAAYRHGLGVEARCSNVFIGPEDEVFIHEWSEEDLERGLRIFTDCLSLWKDIKDF